MQWTRYENIFFIFFTLYEIGGFMVHIYQTLEPISRKLKPQQTVNNSRSYTVVWDSVL